MRSVSRRSSTNSDLTTNGQKLKTLLELKEIVSQRKAEGKRIVFANGCFDVLHVGHTRYLQDAKSKGDFLIVGLNSDDSVRRLKGVGRPILDEHARAALLSALECVDAVVIFQDDTADRLLIELSPNLHCKGGDYTLESVPEKETVKHYGGTTSITGGPKVQSTRWLFENIRKRFTS